MGVEWAKGPWGPPYGWIMGELLKHAYSALKLGQKCGWTREETSRLLSNLRRHGYVEHKGAWHITDAGRAAIIEETQDRPVRSEVPIGFRGTAVEWEKARKELVAILDTAFATQAKNEPRP